MISEERLKELADKNGVLYTVLNKSIIIGMKILKLEKQHKFYVIDIEYCTDFCDESKYFKVHNGDRDKLSFDSLNYLYETKDQAEWERDFKRIGRTEYLDLPSWEELQPKIKDLEVYHGYLIAFNSRFAMEYENGFIDQICLYQNQPPYESWNWNAGKENYIKACEMAKRLFLGKEEK